MAVYSFRIIDDLYSVIKRAGHDLLNEQCVRLNPDEFIATFVRPEHVEPLKKVEELVGNIGDGSTETVFTLRDNHQVTLRIRFANNKPPIILPTYINKGLNPDAPESIVTRIADYANERVRLGLAFGDALDSLRYLNNECSNAPAMSVMFPCLPALLNAAGRDSNDPKSPHFKRAERILKAKSFGSLPKLLPEVRDRILNASNLIQNCLMLEKQPSTDYVPAKHEAQITIYSITKSYPDFIYQSLGQVKNASFV